MMRNLANRAFALVLIAMLGVWPAAAVGTAPQSNDLNDTLSGHGYLWAQYVERFVTADGRVIDNVNGNISHTESQGYGMLLALAANDQPTFERIWRFTDEKLFVRDDGLASWRWAPKDGEAEATEGAITDPNNATDGELLIAWALSEAALAGWGDSYHTRAGEIIDAIAPLFVEMEPFGLQMLPGRDGFNAEAQGGFDVVNLSYWIFPAFEVLQRTHPRPFWEALETSGRMLLQKAADNPAGLPADWLALDRENGVIQPATTFAANGFSYNAIRIPLYLAMAEKSARVELRAGFDHWFRIAGPLWTVDVEAGRGVDALTDPGYEMIRALYYCATRGSPLPEELRRNLDVNYYPATLQLLGLAAVVQRYPQCLA